jgi:hypothetical protein
MCTAIIISIFILSIRMVQEGKQVTPTPPVA